jgi:hypothetical protein
MQQARLQPLNLETWGPVVKAAKKSLNDIKQGKQQFFELTFLGADFEPSPYVQASLNNKGLLVMELVSNEYLTPKISKWNESQLRILGFQVPSDSNPNYHRECQAKEDTQIQANLIIDAPRRVFDLKDSTWFTFGESEYEKALAESDTFWHFKGNPKILCLPGQNESQVVEEK